MGRWELGRRWEWGGDRNGGVYAYLGLHDERTDFTIPNSMMNGQISPFLTVLGMVKSVHSSCNPRYAYIDTHYFEEYNPAPPQGFLEARTLTTQTSYMQYTSQRQPKLRCLPTTSTHTAHIRTCRYEESVPLIDGCHVAVRDLVGEEYLTLVGRHDPVLVAEEILLSGRDKVEQLVTLQSKQKKLHLKILRKVE
jgi:hypothetical protein